MSASPSRGLKSGTLLGECDDGAPFNLDPTGVLAYVASIRDEN